MRPLINNPELNKETLFRTKGQRAPLWYNAHSLGLGYDPSTEIGLVQSVDGQQVGGRYFPKQDKILVYSHSDNWITVATVVHELAHKHMYCKKCNHPPKTKKQESICKYKGEHSSEFYNTLTPMYIESKVPLYAARIVEGNYPYPSKWDNGSYV